MEQLYSLLSHFWSISTELSPWFLLGAVLAGLMTAALPKTILKQKMAGYSGVLTAVGIGVPLPLCSCAVIPTGIGLRRSGASEGASVGFLVSTPQTGLDSILVTAAFLGWTFAFYKVAVALLLGTVAGWILIWCDKKDSVDSSDNSLTKKTTTKPLPILNSETEPQPEQNHSEEKSCCHSDSESEPNKKGSVVEEIWLATVEIMRSIYLWLLIGILISAIISTFLTSDMSQWISEQPMALQVIAMLGVSAPLYVCATASVPIASAFVAKGISVGSSLVFLMAGPATNLATVGAVWKSFSKTAFWTYLSVTIIGSVVFALAFDWLFELQLPSETGHHHSHNNWIGNISAGILLLGCGWFLIKDILKGKLLSRLRFH